MDKSCSSYIDPVFYGTNIMIFSKRMLSEVLLNRFFFLSVLIYNQNLLVALLLNVMWSHLLYLSDISYFYLLSIKHILAESILLAILRDRRDTVISEC